MLKSFIKALGVVAGLALSGFVYAVSLGGIDVTSSLGEPLKAEIALETSGNEETGSLSVRMASPEVFKSAGIDYPSGLPLLTFRIETNPVNGRAYLKITSAQPVNEPFVNLLVEMTWSSGKLLREYTFLLDPPGYVVEQPKLAEVVPVAPVVIVVHPSSSDDASPTVSEPFVTDAINEDGLRGQSESMSAVPATEESVPAAAIPATENVVKGGRVSSGVITDIKVQRGDTLRKLAAQVKYLDVSLERMLVALYRANVDAFEGNNMNRLRAGKILHVPEESELDGLGQAQAINEIRVQVADWHAYRQRLAAASNQIAGGVDKQEVSGKISAKVEDKAPAAKESAKEVVRLSKGEAPGDKAAAADGSSSVQDKSHSAEEEEIARNKIVKESGDRVAILEKNIKAMQRLTELKSQMAADMADAAKQQAGKLDVLPSMSPPVVSAASGNAAASAVQPVKPMSKPKVVVAQPSVMDDVLDKPLYLAGVAAALLGLLGLGLVRSRRAKGGVASKTNIDAAAKAEKIQGSTGSRLAALFGSMLSRVRRKSDKGAISKAVAGVAGVGGAGGGITAPVAPSPETGDFTKTLTSIAGVSHAPTNEVDPISEADLFLNFGRDEQAEEILKDGLAKNPTNYQIHLKLLSIYANRKDLDKFSTIALQVKDSGDMAAWEQVVAMGSKLDPGNPLYGGDGGEASAGKLPPPTAGSDSVIDVGVAKDQATIMDFDLGLGMAEAPAAAEKESVAATEQSPEPSQDKTAELSAPMDFDLTGGHTDHSPSGAESANPASVNMDDLVFDVTGGQNVEKTGGMEDKSESAPAEAEESISYLLDFPGANKPESSESEIAPSQVVANAAALDIDLSEINLNLDMDEPVAATPSAEPAPSIELPAEDAHWDDIATKLDLAKAYQEMGDNSGAREILEEVVRDGDEQQRATAEALLQKLSVQ